MKVLNSPIHMFVSLLVVLLFAVAPKNAVAQLMDPDIFQMVLKSDFNAISTALINGDDINRKTKAGNTALMIAAKIGDRQTIDALLTNKADVNLQNKAGGTALIMAAKYGHPHVVAELLKYGADPTMKTNLGFNAAIFAKAYRHQAIYDGLLKAEKEFKKQAKRKGTLEAQKVST